jgi:hypothetical protein
MERYPDGVVVWYEPFGIEVGKTEIRSGEVVRSDFDENQAGSGWLLLLASEFVLTGVAAFCLTPFVRRHWPKIQGIVWRWDRHF